jgi:hypothetical protein
MHHPGEGTASNRYWRQRTRSIGETNKRNHENRGVRAGTPRPSLPITNSANPLIAMPVTPLPTDLLPEISRYHPGFRRAGDKAGPCSSSRPSARSSRVGRRQVEHDWPVFGIEEHHEIERVGIGRERLILPIQWATPVDGFADLAFVLLSIGWSIRACPNRGGPATAPLKPF